MTNSETFKGTSEESSNLTSRAADKLGDVAAQAKEKATDLGRTAAEKFEQSRSATADALQSTAGSIRSGAQSSSDAISSVGYKTADKLETTANYVRNHDFQGMLRDLEDVVRRSPGPSMIAAAAVGVLLGAALRSRD